MWVGCCYSCQRVNPLFGLTMGILGGLVTYLMLVIRNKFTNVDDTLDVWAVHGMGGFKGYRT
jgi:ammonia channel protein AmtB